MSDEEITNFKTRVRSPHVDFVACLLIYYLVLADITFHNIDIFQAPHLRERGREDCQQDPLHPLRRCLSGQDRDGS